MKRAVFVLVICGSQTEAQDPSKVDEPERLIHGLRSDDLEHRSAAEKGLQDLPTRSIPILKAAVGKETDAEIKLRLRRILRHLLLKESEEIFAGEKLEESLKKSLEADGVEDIEAAYARRLREVDVEIKALVAPPSPPGVGVYPRGEDVDRVWKRHGRWILPSLLAALRDGTNPSSQARSIFILKSILNVAPAIREALRENRDRKDAEFDDNCCMVLHEQGKSEDLRRIAQDEQMSARARETASRLLRQ